MKRIGLTLLDILLMAFPLFSQIINVPADHSTIQAAIDAADAGDTVLVAEGTYFENIGFRGKAITIASMYIMDGDTAHISRTIIDGSKASDPDKATVVTFNNCQDTTSVLNGFTITGGKGVVTTYTDAAGQQISARACGGIHIFNYKNSQNAIIRNNTIYDNHITGDAGTQGGGIFAQADGNTVIIDNNRIKKQQHHFYMMEFIILRCPEGCYYKQAKIITKTNTFQIGIFTFI